MSAYDKLNSKYRKFVDEWLVDHNGKRAAIAAGYAASGAKVRAVELLARDDVKVALAEKQAVRSAEAGNRADRAAARLEAIALMDVGRLKDAPASLLNVVRAAAVDLLKLDGKFTDRVEHTGKDGGPIKIDDISLARWIAFELTKADKET